MWRFKVQQIVHPSGTVDVYAIPQMPLPVTSLGFFRCEGVAPSLSSGFDFMGVSALCKPWSTNGNQPPGFASQPEDGAVQGKVNFADGSYKFVVDINVSGAEMTNWNLGNAECGDDPNNYPINSVAVWYTFRGGLFGMSILHVREIIDFRGRRVTA